MKKEKQKLNILLVSPYLPVGGGISAWTEKYINYMTEHGIEYHLVDLGFVGKRTLDKIVFPDEIKRTVRIVKDLKKSVKQFSCNLAHINTSCSRFGIIRDTWCVRYAYLHNIPVILHCRCNIEDQLKNNNLRKKLFKYMVRRSAHIITLNTPSFNYASLLSAGKTSLLPNFIEKEYCRKHNKNSEKIENVLFVGHVRKGKGVLEIISVAKATPNIQFTLIGPIMSEIESITVPKNVHLLGMLSHDSIGKYYEEADVFLFPSYSEGFANVMLEAMANSLPIIATDVGSNKSMIEEKGGIIVPIKNSQAIIEALLKMDKQDVREKMSKWNYEKVVSKYTVDSVMEDLLKTYYDVLK